MRPGFWLLVLIGAFSCGKKEDPNLSIDDAPKERLYSLLTPEQTNITFRNVLIESESMHGLFYEYYYNGSGVAVADFNRDGLEDIYFVSTLSRNALYLNMGNLKFRDITDQAHADPGKGYDVGVCIVDINQDGLPDIYISRSGRFSDLNMRRNVLMVNTGIKNGIPQFEEQANNYGLDNPSFSTQAAFFDYDRDGDLDLFQINHGTDTYAYNLINVLESQRSEDMGEQLFRNDNGKFTEVTDKSGIINNKLGFCLGLTLGDFNNDQWPDVYVSTDFSGRDHFYINQKNGTFKESSFQSMNHISNSSMGNDVADINNDGWLDLMVLDMIAEDHYSQKTSLTGMDRDNFRNHVAMGLNHQYMYNTLQLNRGIDPKDGLPKFSDIAQLAGVSNTDWSWAPLFIDMDNDGHKDLFISNGIKRDFVNIDFAHYRQQQEDLLKNNQIANKKGFIADLLNHMPVRRKSNYFFMNNGDLTFSKLIDPQVPQYLTCSNGTAYADFDNDGDIDIVLNNSDEIAHIIKNESMESGIGGNFIKIKLNGAKYNLDGIGSRIMINSGGKSQMTEQYTSRGFQSAVTNIIHFGLGQQTIIDSLKIVWPDGKIQVLNQVKANQTIELNYKNATKNPTEETPTLVTDFSFADISSSCGIDYSHQENEFDDFKRELLLPYKLSALGPALAVGDINNDQLDDVYIGGAANQAGAMYVQTSTGKFVDFQSELWREDASHEDVAAAFFDADGDGDQDLYIVSGGNEKAQNADYYQDRFYENDHGKYVKRPVAIPGIRVSGSVVKAADVDMDGDLDLFLGGRQVPGEYPAPASSHLLINESIPGKIRFIDRTDENAPFLKEIGMVTDASWVDVNGDGLPDLAMVGEWMPLTIAMNNHAKLSLDKTNYDIGWWSAMASADFDRDGDMDIVAGNFGLNSKFKATVSNPLSVYLNDFDNNGKSDIIMGYNPDAKEWPIRSRKELNEQMHFIFTKYPTNDAFAKASLEDIFGKESLENALHFLVTELASCYYENLGNGKFKKHILPVLAQVAPINFIEIEDFDDDGKLDILIAGNLYQTEEKTPRQDAGYGLVLMGDGLGTFQPLSANDTRLFVQGDVKRGGMFRLALTSTPGLIILKNDSTPQIIMIE
ncbi:MAG: VCBS repeat-containing protein [Cyclobacteriaceae bacterium]|nr:VCBS repeat-containing protein [Cyclobacteriaceae bacterium]